MVVSPSGISSNAAGYDADVICGFFVPEYLRDGNTFAIIAGKEAPGAPEYPPANYHFGRLLHFPD
jgi:hypothetical protein